MNKPTRILLCLLLSLCMILSCNTAPFYAISANAASFVYPQGVTAADADMLAEKADEIIIKLTEKLGTDSDLSATLSSVLYADETMNSLLLSLYGASEGQTKSEIAWMDVTPQTVAQILEEKHPSVAREIATSETWSEVNLDNAHWDIASDEAFADAVGTLLIPFSDFLMTLLCGENFKIVGNIIKISGNNGYEDAVIPAFDALGCTDYLSYGDYVAAAKSDKAKLGANIILPLLGLVNRIGKAPVGTLTEVLPNAAYFINAGGVENCINELMSPINSLTDNVLIRLFAGDSLSALSSLTDESTLLGDFSGNLIPTLNKMLADSGITLPDIDWEQLSSCGTLTNGRVIANKGQTFIFLFRYLWNTISVNKDSVTQMLANTGEQSVPAEYSDMLMKMTDASADDVLSLLCRLLCFDGSFAYYPMTYGAKADFTSAFAQGMTRENYTRMLGDIDRVLYMAISEFAEFDDTAEYLRELIFSNKTVWQLCGTVYSYIGQADMTAVSDIISLDFSADKVASLLSEAQYASAASALLGGADWETLKNSSVSWGFADGDAMGFVNAVCAALRPLEPFFDLLLAGGSIEILDLFSVHGGYGYNNAVIPLLEALGCSTYAIVTNEQYLKEAQSDKDNLIYNILFPLAALIDSVCERPIKTLASVLPNIVYFIENDGLTQCIDNLIKPLTELFNEVGKVIELDGFDMSALTDIDTSLSSVSLSEMLSGVTDTGDLPISVDLESLDLTSMGGMGELKQLESKAVSNGVQTSYSYVEADGEEVIAYILRFAVETIKSEENSGLLSSLMSSGTESEEPSTEEAVPEGETAAAPGMDMSSMFSSSASGMLDELKAMSVDETVCWLYNFFFREHAVPQQEDTQSYVPNIKYVATESETDIFAEKLRSGAIIFCLSVAAAGAVAGIVILAVKKRKTAKKETH